MLAKAIRDRFWECPAKVAAFGTPDSVIDIRIGSTYEVHAISLFKEVLFFQIVNDISFISWLPSWFFEVTSPDMPPDWICNVQNDELQMIIGPTFVAASEAAYNSMVEMESDTVTLFWKRVDGLKLRD